MTRIMIAAAGLGGVAAVALGASSAHLGLDAALLDTASRYLMYHSLALLAVSLLRREAPSVALQIAAWCFLIGMIAFAGGLVAKAATAWPQAAASTPVGGTLFMLGWLSVAWYGVGRRG